MKVNNNNFNQVGIPSIEFHQRSFQLSRVKKLGKLKNKLKLTINERENRIRKGVELKHEQRWLGLCVTILAASRVLKLVQQQ